MEKPRSQVKTVFFFYLYEKVSVLINLWIKYLKSCGNSPQHFFLTLLFLSATHSAFNFQSIISWNLLVRFLMFKSKTRVNFSQSLEQNIFRFKIKTYISKGPNKSIYRQTTTTLQKTPSRSENSFSRLSKMRYEKTDDVNGWFKP